MVGFKDVIFVDSSILEYFPDFTHENAAPFRGAAFGSDFVFICA